MTKRKPDKDEELAIAIKLLKKSHVYLDKLSTMLKRVHTSEGANLADAIADLDCLIEDVKRATDTRTSTRA